MNGAAIVFLAAWAWVTLRLSAGRGDAYGIDLGFAMFATLVSGTYLAINAL